MCGVAAIVSGQDDDEREQNNRPGNQDALHLAQAFSRGGGMPSGGVTR